MNKGILYLVCPPLLYVTALWALSSITDLAPIIVCVFVILLYLYFTRNKEHKPNLNKKKIALTILATAILVVTSLLLTDEQPFKLIAIFTPISEEIVFRELSFKRSKINPIIAGVVSTALFAVAHGLAIETIIASAIAGLVLCALYYKTESLSSTIASHILANAIIMFI